MSNRSKGVQSASIRTGIDESLAVLLVQARLTVADLARELELSLPAASNKLHGRRPWVRDDIDRLLRLLSRRIGKPVKYEQLFTRGANGA